MRRQERVRLIYQLRIFETVTGWLVGHVVDITSTGILVVGERPVKAGREYELRMDLPRNVMSDGSLTLRAQCRWCRAEEVDADTFTMGFDITVIDAETRSIVETLIRDFYGEDDRDDPIVFNPPLEEEK